MISQKSYYLTADRQNVVEEGDPKAQFLLVRAGMELPDALAEQYGLSGKKAAAPPPAQSAPADSGPEPKNREQAMPKLKTRGGKKSPK